MDTTAFAVHDAQLRNHLENGRDWIIQHLPEAELNVESVAEIACNAIRRNDLHLLMAALQNGGQHLNATIERMEPLSDCIWTSETKWTTDLERVSHRLIDMILEASLFRSWSFGIVLALEHGADPNLHLWTLERSYNEHHTGLSWAINNNRGENEEDAEKIATALLEHPGFQPGTTHAKALCDAIRRGRDVLVERMISKGVSFENSELPDWLALLPPGQEPDWPSCYWLYGMRDWAGMERGLLS